MPRFSTTVISHDTSVPPDHYRKHVREHEADSASFARGMAIRDVLRDYKARGNERRVATATTTRMEAPARSALSILTRYSALGQGVQFLLTERGSNKTEGAGKRSVSPPSYRDSDSDVRVSATIVSDSDSDSDSDGELDLPYDHAELDGLAKLTRQG